MKYFIRTIICIFSFMALFSPLTAAADAYVSSGPSILFEDGSVYTVQLVDSEREAGKIAVYTRNYGESTKPFAEYVREFVVVNNIIVHKSTSQAVGTYIPPNGCVISYTGNDEDFLKRLETGSELTLSGISLPASPDMYFVTGDLLVPIDKTNVVRDANQVVLYSPAFGESTKTNIWGLELTVVGNTVTKVAKLSNDSAKPSESDSQIPASGVVISVHMGNPYYKQLNEAVKAGDAIRVSADAKLYNASKIAYAAYNPRTIADNPAAWDAGEKKPYDGFRGPNQLIVYDSGYGESTGTNPYGYEVTVNSEGIITGSGGSDSPIPEGGYVLSGHGESLTWLEKYAALGARVTLNTAKKTVTIILSPDSYLNMAAFSIKTAKDSLELARQQHLDIQYDKSQETISTAEAKLRSLEEQAAAGLYEGMTNTAAEIQGIADDAYYMTFESMKAENRAVWLRPNDTSIEQIKKRLDMLKELNINILYLETYWGGYAIYPTGDPYLKQNPMFNGLDILEAYLKEAHARGIEVHAWVENFLTGSPVADVKPEWMSVSRKGDTWYLENGTTKYHFLNPALPEVRDFLSGIYRGLIKKYNIDGIQFDYMRYSNSGDYTNDFGYDSYTRQLFASYTGTDPISLKPGDPLWESWCGFRTQIISFYAYRVISEIKSLKPDIKISADVWPEYDETIVDIYQDSKSWVRKGYINSLIPMSYYLNEGAVVEDINNTLEFTRGNSQITSGIASFNKVDPKVFLKQVHGIRNSNTRGISIFEFESLFSRGYNKVLKPGAFSASAAVTNRNPEQSVKLLFDDIVRKIDEIYVGQSAMTEAQAEVYKEAVRKLGSNTAGGVSGLEAAYSFKEAVEKTILRLAKDESLDKAVADRIIYDLNSVIYIIDGCISDGRFLAEHRAVRFQLEMSLKAPEDSKTIPYKVKAVFGDGSSMYLDATQYSIKSSNPAAADVSGDSLVIKDGEGTAVIMLDILDSFRFGSAGGADQKAGFAVNHKGQTLLDPYYGVLRAAEESFTSVSLDWGSTIANSDIAGYILYCNDQELTRTPAESFRANSLKPGETYSFLVKAFDRSGSIVYESNKLTVTTKALPLMAK